MRWNGKASLRRGAVAFAFVLVACGVHSTPAGYIEGLIGPGGGTLETATARCDIPAGAFTEDIICAIFQEFVPPPTDPGAGPLTYLLPCTCIGPLGTPLAVDGTLRVCYDPSDIPIFSSESDLVLLEWDDIAGFMRIVPGAVQNTTTHCFTDANYAVLGHVGVAARTGPRIPFDFTFVGTPPPVGGLAIQPQGFDPPPGLVLADTTGTVSALPVDGTAGASEYLGSRDGTRVLFTLRDSESEQTALWTVPTADVGPFTPVEVLPNGTFSPSEPQFGWLGDQDRVYHVTSTMLLPQEQSPGAAFAARDGDGTGPVDPLESKFGSAFVDDVRVSPDRSMVMIRWLLFGKGFDYEVDVIDAVSGTPIGSDLPVPFGGRMPRWLPDSSGIYFVDDGATTITRIDPDGTGAATLYTLPAVLSSFDDFVVAPPFDPDPQRCAYVRTFDGINNNGVPLSGPQYYETDALAGGDVESTSIGGPYDVVEMVPLFSDSWQTSLVLLQLSPQFLVDLAQFPVPPTDHTLVYPLGSGGLWADIPVPISSIDLSRQTGREGHFLIWIQRFDDNYLEYPNPGVYATDEFAQNPVDVTPAGWTIVQPPRWLQSWRFSPGFQSFSPRVR